MARGHGTARGDRRQSLTFTEIPGNRALRRVGSGTDRWTSLAAGRHVSSDASSHGFMREIPQCWLTGQAAGAAAAVAANAGVQPRCRYPGGSGGAAQAGCLHSRAGGALIPDRNSLSAAAVCAGRSSWGEWPRTRRLPPNVGRHRAPGRTRVPQQHLSTPTTPTAASRSSAPHPYRMASCSRSIEAAAR